LRKKWKERERESVCHIAVFEDGLREAFDNPEDKKESQDGCDKQGRELTAYVWACSGA